MPVWLIALGLGVGLPMLLSSKDNKNGQQGQQGQQGQAPSPQQVNGWANQLQAAPPPQSYPIPLDASIDNRSAYAVYQAYLTAPSDQLIAFAMEIRMQFPIAAAVLWARGETMKQIQQASQQAIAQRQAQAQAQALAQAQAQAQAQAVAQAQAQAAEQARQQAAKPAVSPVEAMKSGQFVPATQEVRVVPSPNIQPEGAPAAQPAQPAVENGAAQHVPAAVQLGNVQEKVPVQGGVG